MRSFKLETNYTRDMKKKITFAICAVWMLAGFFGLQAVSESGLPFVETLGIILAIGIAEAPAVIIANHEVKKEKA